MFTHIVGIHIVIGTETNKHAKKKDKHISMKIELRVGKGITT